MGGGGLGGGGMGGMGGGMMNVEDNGKGTATGAGGGGATTGGPGNAGAGAGRGGGGAGGGPPRPGRRDYTSLMNAISTTIEPDSWEELSGPGSMIPVHVSGSLVVRQTWNVHRKVLQLLRDLRAARELAGPGEAP